VRVTPDLNLLNATLICPRDTLQRNPSIVFNSENHVVAWSDLNFNQTNYYIAAARVDTSGSVIDTGICITTGSGENENFPKIAYDGNRCLVIWEKSGGIDGRFINSNGQPEGSIFSVTTQSNGEPALAFDGVNYLVVWSSIVASDHFITGQLVSTTGNPVGSTFVIANDTTPLQLPDIVFDNTKYFVAWCQSWASDPLVCGQFLDTNGGLIGGNFSISDENTGFRREDPTVVASDSNYLVVWDEYRSSLTSDLYGNIDVVLQGIANKGTGDYINNEWDHMTVFSGSLQLPRTKNLKVFDITGREIITNKINPGIYFIQVDGKITHKVIKIK